MVEGGSSDNSKMSADVDESPEQAYKFYGAAVIKGPLEPTLSLGIRTRVALICMGVGSLDSWTPAHFLEECLAWLFFQTKFQFLRNSGLSNRTLVNRFRGYGVHHRRCMLDVGHCPLYPDRSIRGRALLYSK